MPKKLVFKPESIERTRKIVDEGLYYVTLTGFAAKVSSKGDSINYNPIMELSFLADGVTPAPFKDDGKPIPVFYNGNSKAEWALNDMVHGFGLPMETITVDGTTGLSLPGIWVPEAEEDISKCEYKGPLVGRKAQVYLVKETYNGTEQNKIKYFVCAVPNCAQKFPRIKHSTNLN